MLLLTDIWERPADFVETFSAGGAPTVADVVIAADELAIRIAAADSETELVGTESEAQIRRLHDGTIEEWMVYLHPSQRAIARADFNGPSRVRGGPGTGKTVVALHRARRLAREAPSGQRVLLTTFLRTLPKVWEGLMRTLDRRALERLDIVNLDALAVRIVRDATGRGVQITGAFARSRFACLRPASLRNAVASTTGCGKRHRGRGSARNTVPASRRRGLDSMPCTDAGQNP